MKKLFTRLLLVTMFLVVGCETAFDDSEIWDKLNDHESRIAKLEELCKQMNTNITALQAIVNALQNNDYITNVAPISKDGEVVGYTITFAKSDSITIYNGTNGQDGENGTTPVIGVKQDADEVYYWTLNGDWLTDEAGNKIKAQGSDGKDGTDGEDGQNGADGKDGVDGITPKLLIIEDYWCISYDDGETWYMLAKAVGEDGKDGQDGADGKDGDSFFKSVTQDDDYVYFTLADGTELVVPKSNNAVTPDMKNNKIYYTTIDGRKMFPSYPIGIDAVLLSNSYENGQGVLTYDDEVTTLGNAFNGCTTLESVTIPESVTSMGTATFWKCSSLKTVYCKPSTPPSAVFGGDSQWLPFDGNASGRKIYVSAESVNSYRNANYWSRYASAIVAEGDSSETKITKIYYTTTNGQPLSITYSKFDAVFAGNAYDEESGKFLLTFEGEMTSIPNNAFSSQSKLATIIIPEGITSIGDNAFLNCSSLYDVRLPDGLETIGVATFSGCSNLYRISIPATVTSFGSCAFDNCESLTRVDITDMAAWCNIDIPDWYSAIFYDTHDGSIYLNGTEITELVIPEGVTEIKPFVFCGCTSLTSVSIPDGVTSIGERAFYHCDNLADITFGNGVASIGDDCFYGCALLKSVTLPDSMETIGNGAFENCYALESLNLGNGVKTIGESAFEGCSALTSITIPASVTSVGNQAFYECSLSRAYITDLAAWCNIDFADITANPLYSAQVLFLNDEVLTNAVIPDGVTTIKPFVFRNCISLTKVTIPDSVTSIGEEAFGYCSSLANVDLGNGVQSIGKHAFYKCSSLTAITIPASVTSVESQAFGNASFGCALKRVDITDMVAWCNIDFEDSESNPIQYAKKLYLNGTEVTEAVIPSDASEVKPYVFQGLTSLTGVTIHDGVSAIGAGAFEDCSALSGITIPASVVSIGDQAFNGCKMLSRVDISNLSAWCRIDFASEMSNPLNEGGKLYLEGGELTTAAIPADITEIKQFAFYGCGSLTGVTLHNGITSVGKRAFAECMGITEITVPASVTYLGYEAFCNNNLTTARVLSTTPCELGKHIAGGGIFEQKVYYNQFGYGNAKIYVPAESLYDYKAATGWSTMADNIYPME